MVEKTVLSKHTTTILKGAISTDASDKNKSYNEKVKMIIK
jgi:hypothetical protein